MTPSRDRLALEELFKFSGAGASHEVEHYLYFATEASATTVTTELLKRGCDVNSRPSAAENSWLVLAKQVIVPTEEALRSTRKSLEQLTDEQGGEYDGWEAQVIDDDRHT